MLTQFTSSKNPAGDWVERAWRHVLAGSWLTCVYAALVAVSSAQTEASMAGITRWSEGRGGVDGVSSAS